MSMVWRVIYGALGVWALGVAVLMLTTHFEPTPIWSVYLVLGVLALDRAVFNRE